MQKEPDVRFISFLEEIVESCSRPGSITNTEKTKSDVILAGATLALIFAPWIAPWAALPGLTGAAAFSNGLATLGGGSLAAGGAGMYGGVLNLGIAGGVLGALALPHSKHSYETTLSQCFKKEISKRGKQRWSDFRFQPQLGVVYYFDRFQMNERFYFEGTFRNGYPWKGSVYFREENHLQLRWKGVLENFS